MKTSQVESSQVARKQSERAASLRPTGTLAALTAFATPMAAQSAVVDGTNEEEGQAAKDRCRARLEAQALAKQRFFEENAAAHAADAARRRAAAAEIRAQLEAQALSKRDSEIAAEAKAAAEAQQQSSRQKSIVSDNKRRSFRGFVVYKMKGGMLHRSQSAAAGSPINPALQARARRSWPWSARFRAPKANQWSRVVTSSEV